MENLSLPQPLWAVLDGGLWHATGTKQLKGIIADREISVQNKRYKSSFSKSLNAVSLFDFGPTAADYEQFSNWVGWMGHQQESRVAVWLEIDRKAVASNLLDAGATHRAWLDNLLKPTLIPGVEACHKGPLPFASVVSILLIDQHYKHSRFQKCPMVGDIVDTIERFEASLPPPPPENEFVKRLQEALDLATKQNRA